ncbi:MAG: hypothetical protein PF442_11885 [Desulfobulbaceae bacterium]|jgi:hypothetical protein|nr:hypothetical protein [Desulfobulbaceae bacterium]
MKPVHKFRKNQPVVWFDRKKEKSNQYCLYCGVPVGIGSEAPSNKEHLIGRQFVPTGSFQEGSQFNFIFRACEVCNSNKSELERHVSSVTLLNSIHKQEKREYVERAISKASRDFHPLKPGVLVKDATDTHVFKFNIGALSMKFEATSPPQVSQQYIRELSFYHVQGLFSLITSKAPDKESGTCLLPESNFWFHRAYNHGDWGNAELTELSKRAEELRCYANINTADGNFKAMLCRIIDKPGCWFWALEWNKHLRVVGGIYSHEECPMIFEGLPAESWKSFGKGSDGVTRRIKEETPLDESNDILFSYEVYSGEGP